MVSRLLFFALIALVSCSEPHQRTSAKYLDLQTFFKNEATRLKHLSARVDKTVNRNGISESRKNISPNWNVELSLFIESDINKPAWVDGYRISKVGMDTHYTAIDSNLRTRSISIKQNESGKLIDLAVLNKTTNSLYSSVEELRYIPDSLYRIVKRQDVVLLGKNSYEITGFFK